MQIDEILMLALAFAVVCAASFVVLGRFGAQGASRRIKLAAARAQSTRAGAAPLRTSSAATRPIDWLVRRVWARTGSSRSSDESPLRLRLQRAGWRDADTEARFLAARALLVCALPALFALGHAFTPAMHGMAGLAGGALLFAACGWCLPGLWLDRRVVRRQSQLIEHFPDAIDMIRLCVQAGLGLDAAIARVERELRMTCWPLHDELHLVTLEMRAGASRERALKNLALRTGVPEMEALVSMLIQVERLGTGVAESLRIHSGVLRTRRRQRAQEQAAKVSVKLLFPLIFCIFPALLIVLLGPAMLSVLRVLKLSAVAG